MDDFGYGEQEFYEMPDYDLWETDRVYEDMAIERAEEEAEHAAESRWLDAERHSEARNGRVRDTYVLLVNHAGAPYRDNEGRPIYVNVSEGIRERERATCHNSLLRYLG